MTTKPARKKGGNLATKPGSVPAVPYEPTATEKAALTAYDGRRNAQKPAPPVRLTKNATTGAFALDMDHADPPTGQRLLMEALGTAEPAFLDGLLSQLANAGTHGKELSERPLNQLIATVVGIAPRDHVEAMLASQMALTNSLVMTFARRLNHVDNIQQQDSASNALNKLMRTYATQADTLKRYRSSGDQKMTVEHVTVQAGGQAIVGTVNRGEGGNGKS